MSNAKTPSSKQLNMKFSRGKVGNRACWIISQIAWKLAVKPDEILSFVLRNHLGLKRLLLLCDIASCDFSTLSHFCAEWTKSAGEWKEHANFPDSPHKIHFWETKIYVHRYRTFRSWWTICDLFSQSGWFNHIFHVSTFLHQAHVFVNQTWESFSLFLFWFFSHLTGQLSLIFAILSRITFEGCFTLCMIIGLKCRRENWVALSNFWIFGSWDFRRKLLLVSREITLDEEVRIGWGIGCL